MIVGAIKKKKTNQAEKKADSIEKIIDSNEDYIKGFIDNRDYIGAATFIDFMHTEMQVPYTKDMQLWHGYCLFHSGQYSDSIEIYQNLLKQDPNDKLLYLYIASCHYYNQDYDLALENAKIGPDCDYKTRLLFHIYQQQHNEEKVLEAHSQMVGTLENQLSLAAIHFMRSNFPEAIDIYQKILLENPDFIALYVYIAMCLFKMENYEESNENVDQYLSVNSDSAVSLNLKSCVYLKLFGSEVAESQLLQIKKFSSSNFSFVDTLINHNLVIFHNGDDGFNVLPKIVSLIPEASYNLALLYLKENKPEEASLTLQNQESTDVNSAFLEATINVSLGQLTENVSLIESGCETFLEIGEMENIKDTVTGRECLASAKFITGEYKESLRIMESVEEALSDSDEYNYNKAMILCQLSRFNEAEKYFSLVQNENYKNEIFYTSWLSLCYIKTHKPEKAWDLYVETTSTEDANTLLRIISNECFKEGQFYYSMKAFTVLSQFDMDSTIKEGLIASSVAVFRSIISGKESTDKFIEVLAGLNTEPSASHIVEIIDRYIDNIDSGELDY